MKHYINIHALKEEDVIFNDEVTRRRNDLSFQKGDRIIISEKYDGSNASITLEKGQLKCFSHKRELDYQNTLNGFYNFVNKYASFLIVFFTNNGGRYTIFGGWSGQKNKLVYNEDAKGKMYLFDIWDNVDERWLDYGAFKVLADTLDTMTGGMITPVHVLYDGEFVSWEHCKSFMNSPYYGEKQEGIVVRDVSAFRRNAEAEGRDPWILKVVNDDFKESMIKAPKEVNLEKEAAKQNAVTLLSQVVTKARVEKIILKLQNEENVLPRQLEPKDMGLVARNLPKAVYEDLLKEEPEIVKACGEYGGKTCNQLTMQLAKQILL